MPLTMGAYVLAGDSLVVTHAALNRVRGRYGCAPRWLEARAQRWAGV